MASPAYEQILAIQAFDLSLRQLAHRVRTHPARQKLADGADRLAELQAQRTEIEERKHDLERQQKRCQDEVATIAARRGDIESKLYGGEVTATKELLALQEESANLLERQGGIEDGELELMEQLDDIAGELAAVDEQRAATDAENAAAEVELAEALVELDGEIKATTSQRSEAAVPANAELLASYEELRDLFDGVAVARLVDGSCDGCHIHLSAMAVDRIGKMPEDAVVTCEECGRLLVR